jgi:hypothetical protein
MGHNNRMTQIARTARPPAQGPGTWLALAGLAVLAAGGIGLLFVRTVYHEWPWSAYPPSLHVCGRDYLRGGADTRAQIRADGYHPFHRLGSLSWLLHHAEVWGTASAALGTSARPSGCGTVLWVRTGSDRFEAYALSGGP